MTREDIGEARDYIDERERKELIDIAERARPDFGTVKMTLLRIGKKLGYGELPDQKTGKIDGPDEIIEKLANGTDESPIFDAIHDPKNPAYRDQKIKQNISMISFLPLAR